MTPSIPTPPGESTFGALGFVCPGLGPYPGASPSPGNKHAARIGLFFAAFCLLAWPRPASATSVTWTLSGVTFANGATASGSFVYDANTNTYTSIGVTVAGSSFGNGAYTVLDPGFPSTSTLLVVVPSILADFTNTPVLAFDFTSALTNSGGTTALGTLHGIQMCTTTTCDFSTIVSSVATGQVTSAVSGVVPEPSGLFLFGTGLLGLAGAVRRKWLS